MSRYAGRTEGIADSSTRRGAKQGVAASPAAKSWLLAPALVGASLVLVGCGESDGGKQFSQDFEKPAGVVEKADPDANLSRGQIRRKEIEESKQEPIKGKRRR